MFTFNGPDNFQNGNHQHAYLEIIPDGETYTFTFEEHAGTEVSGLLHFLDGDTRENYQAKSGPDADTEVAGGGSYEVAGPKIVIASAWFKRKGGDHEASWEQMVMKRLHRSSNKITVLGFDDIPYKQKPDNDYNDYIISINRP